MLNAGIMSIVIVFAAILCLFYFAVTDQDDMP
jgi:hypothetical protein